MIEIKDLLARFEHILLGEDVKIDSILQTLRKVAGVKIERKDIKIKNNIIYLDTKPIYKNQIFLKKEQIAEELEDIFGTNAPKEVR
jgi:hypothetical protein